jgi:hypothetical protein
MAMAFASTFRPASGDAYHGNTTSAKLGGLNIADAPFTPDFTLKAAEFDRSGKQFQASLDEAERNRQFSAQEAERNRYLSIAQQLDATSGAFAKMMTTAGRTAALKEYEPAQQFYQKLMNEGMFNAGEINNLAAGQYEQVGKGSRSALDQAANAARAGGARSAGALALAGGAINAEALGAMGKLKTELIAKNKESQLAGAQGYTGIAAQRAGLQATTTQEEAQSFYGANSPLNALLKESKARIDGSDNTKTNNKKKTFFGKVKSFGG